MLKPTGRREETLARLSGPKNWPELMSLRPLVGICCDRLDETVDLFQMKAHFGGVFAGRIELLLYLGDSDELRIKTLRDRVELVRDHCEDVFSCDAWPHRPALAGGPALASCAALAIT